LTRTRKPQVLEHLLRLEPHDRRLRFGVARSGHDLARYVASIDDAHDILLGAVTSSGDLLGVAHMAVERGVAELGLSVDGRARRRGVGVALANEALREARRSGAHEFRFDCAADNAGMRAIAERLQMEFERDGAEVIARRTLSTDLPEPLAA
jgi:RimJ/RimL family protein N-acetyltransferase